jgi:hypothetical protein
VTVKPNGPANKGSPVLIGADVYIEMLPGKGGK